MNVLVIWSSSNENGLSAKAKENRGFFKLCVNLLSGVK